MKQLAEWCVKRPVTILMTFVMVIVLGCVSYIQLPVQFLPDITLPTVGVFAQRETNAEDNLEKITRPLENLVADLPGVKRIQSWTRNDRVFMQVDFEYGTDVRLATSDLNDRLVNFRNSLEDRRTFINAFPFSTEQFEASYMFLSVRGKGDLRSLFEATQDRVVEQLSTIDGVARVEVQGSTADAATVELDSEKLAGYGLEFRQVLGRISAAASEDTFLGRLDVPGETHYVRLDDRVKNVDQLAEVYVDPNGIIPLRNVATITVGSVIDQSIFRTAGKNAIWLELQRENDSNMIELAKKTRARVEQINRTLPKGVELVIEEDLVEYVERALASVKKSALYGAILSLIIPLVFFRSVRLALIVGLAVPICLVAVFNLFLVAGMSVNIFSIIGLAIGVGMVVDNSIVVSENCFRLMGTGHYSPREAAMLGAGEVSKALFASTATTAVVFLPLVFLEGEFRLFVKEPTLAFVFPVAISWIVATTLCPVLVFMTLRGSGRRTLHQGNPRVREAYRLCLKWAIRNRGRVILIVGAVIVFTMFESFVQVQQQTTGREPEGNFIRVFLRVPRGTPLSDVNRSVAVVEERLAQMKDIKRFSVAFNSSEARFNLGLHDPDKRPSKRSTREIRKAIIDEIGAVPLGELSLNRNDIPTPASRVSLGESGTIEVRGLDRNVIDPYAERLIEALRALPDVTTAKVEEEAADPEYLVQIDRDRSRLFGVNAQTISQYISATRSAGSISSLQLVDGDKRIDVAVAVKDFDGSTIDETKRLSVFTQAAGNVRLGDITSVAASNAQVRIVRTNRQTSEEISYFYRPGADKAATNEQVKGILRTLPNPGGVDAEVTGEQKKLDDRQKQFFFMVIAGTLLVYMTMAAVFESFWVPFVIVIMVTLVPLGTKWALGLVGLPLDDLAVFGFILLIGIVVNAGIVMMDRTLELMRDRSYRRTRAVFTAADTRLRPIVMTYLTTVIGLLPLAMQGDETSQWRPVAVTIIGGLTTSTIITLFAMPSFFLIGDDFVRWARPPFLRTLGLALRSIEWVGNAGTQLVISVLCVWKWRPREWPGVVKHSIRTAALWVWARIPRVNPLKLAWRAARAGVSDVRWAAGHLVRRPQPAVDRGAEPLSQLESTESTRQGEAPIVLHNLHLIYPVAGAKGLRRYLPARGYALGHRPVEGFHALKGISTIIGPGLYGLLGPNGAGKTTMLRCIAGLSDPTRGNVRLFGTTHQEAPAQLAPLIGYLPQNHGHYEAMSLYEYLDYFATLTARTLSHARALNPDAGEAIGRRLASLIALNDPRERHAAISRAIEEVNLIEHAHELIGSFSGGMKQRAGIARILLQAPPILIVDEPTAGLDPVERVKVRLLLARLAETRTVLFSTHIVEDLEQTCRQIGILLHGRMVFSGTPEDLKSRWDGRVFEVLLSPDEHPESVRASLLERGSRVLFQVVRGGAEGFRVIAPSGAPPRNGLSPVAPTLEDALLATLAAQRGT